MSNPKKVAGARPGRVKDSAVLGAAYGGGAARARQPRQASNPSAPALPEHSLGQTRLYHVQQARVEALRAAREVLATTSNVMVASSTTAPEATDLLDVAEWILSGKDWRETTGEVIHVLTAEVNEDGEESK